jgi:hypothetical protein
LVNNNCKMIYHTIAKTISLPKMAIQNKDGLIYKKERGSQQFTRPTLRGSGIAQLVRTSNAEAHAVCIYTRNTENQ